MLFRLFRRASSVMRYQRVASDDEVKLHMLDPDARTFVETDLGDQYQKVLVSKKSKSCLSWSLLFLMTVVNLALFSGTCGMFYYHLGPMARSSDKEHMKATSNHSPLFDALDMKMHTQKVNGTLFALDESQTFRKFPDPEVNAAWEKLAETPLFLVDRKDLELSGKDPKYQAKAPESWGEGPEKYMALLDGHHQMHCLQEIRKQAFAEHFYPDGPQHPLHWPHVIHCLDMLRQAIMCSASVDLITSIWTETQPGPYPDFNIQRQCRDYEATLDWAHKAGDHIFTEERKPSVLNPPADAIVLPMEPGFWEYYPALHEWNQAHPDALLEEVLHGGHHHHE